MSRLFSRYLAEIDHLKSYQIEKYSVSTLLTIYYLSNLSYYNINVFMRFIIYNKA